MAKFDDIFKKKVSTILSIIDEMEKRASKVEKILFKQLEREFLNKLDFKDGSIKPTLKNIAQITKIDAIFKKLEKTIGTQIIAHVSESMLEIILLNNRYYEALGTTKKLLDSIQDANKTLEFIIGIDSKGELAKGGYLDQLTKNEKLRADLKQFAMQKITTPDIGFLDFRDELELLVKGAEGKDKRNGMLRNHYRSFAYDKFNQADETINKVYADGLGFKHFLYGGSKIDNTRKTCLDWAGKYFTTEEGENFVNHPDLIDKKSNDTYVYYIDRGKNNCRHYIQWIPEKLYLRRVGKN